MKIIDLLNKIANGEEVPEHIKIGKNEWYFYKSKNTYGDKKSAWIVWDWYVEENKLNDEVEILEEKKIPEKLEEFGIIQYNLDYIDYKNIETLKEWLNKDFQTIYDTLDLIIKNQNKLIDYLKRKGVS